MKRVAGLTRTRGVILLLLSLVAVLPGAMIIHPAVADGAGFYDLSAQTGYITDVGRGINVGIYGTSSQYANKAPNCCDLHPQFYAGIESKAHDIMNTNDIFGITDLHVTVTATDPNGGVVPGGSFAPRDVQLSPDSSSSSTVQPVLTFIYNAILNALPWGIGSDIQSATSNAGGLSNGISGNTGYADWTDCNSLGCPLGDYYHGLWFGFQMQIGTAFQGTYSLTIHYHLEIHECFGFSQLRCTSGSSTITQDLYDNAYYCYVKCTNFTMYDSQPPITLTPGHAVNDGITVIATNTNPSPVLMSATADPSIATSFSPQALTLTHSGPPDNPNVSGVTVLTISIASCNPGTYTITVFADARGLEYTMPIQVTVQCNGAAFVSQTPLPSTMLVGSTAAVSVTMKNTGQTTWMPEGSANPYRLGSQNPQDNTYWGNTVYISAIGLTASRITLSSQVPPGAQYTFAFTVTAPSTPGTYNFQWRMVNELIEWFGDYSPNVQVNVQTGNGATFVSQTPPPSTMTVGQTATVSVTMKNTGTSTWMPEGSANQYRLGSQNPQDNTYWGNTVYISQIGLTASRITLSSQVPPGAQYTFAFTVTAPSTPGTYNFQWRMVNELVEWFGDYSPNVLVTVIGGTVLSNDPSSSSWGTRVGNWALVNGYLDGSGTSAQIISANTFASDRTVTVNARTVTPGSQSWYTAWIRGKYSGSGDAVTLILGNGPTLSLDLAISSNGAVHHYTANTNLPPVTSWHSISMVFAGNEVKVFVDGTLYIDATDAWVSILGADSVAMASWGTSESQFDSVTVS